MINFTINDARNEDFSHEIKIISRNKKNHSQWWMKIASLSTFDRVECNFVSLILFLLIASSNKWSKNQHQLTKINKNINKEIFFHFNEFVELIIETIILERKIMLRSRFKYEYVTLNHWHDRSHIELDNLTNLASSLISWINSTNMSMFRSFAMRNRKWTWDFKRRFYKWVFNKLISRTTWVRLINETASIQKQSRS